MSILLYAISRDDARAPAAELRQICAAGLRALAEPVEEPLRADLEQLVRYEETVEAVMRHHTILPMRFGSVVGDEDEARSLLQAHAHEFGAALTHLDGAIEFGVQASLTANEPAGDAAATGSGADYMRRRLAEQRTRQELQRWLDEALAGVAREGIFRATPISGPTSISAAYLVERGQEDQFTERLRDLAGTAAHHLSWSGPWPPYSFVEGLEA